MTPQIFEAHERINTPTDFIAPMRKYVEERAKTKEQRFRADREAELLANHSTAASNALDQARHRRIAEADKERDRDLGVVLAEEKRAGQPPVRAGNDTGSEYSDKVSLYNAQQVQALRRANLAESDAQFVRESSDPAAVADVINEWIASPDYDVSRRVARVAEQRLRVLAEQEAAPGATTNGPAFMAHLSAQNKLKAWRTEQERKSFAFRRQEILDRHALTVSQIERQVASVRQSFELDGPYAQFRR